MYSPEFLRGDISKHVYEVGTEYVNLHPRSTRAHTARLAWYYCWLSMASLSSLQRDEHIVSLADKGDMKYVHIWRNRKHEFLVPILTRSEGLMLIQMLNVRYEKQSTISIPKLPGSLANYTKNFRELAIRLLARAQSEKVAYQNISVLHSLRAWSLLKAGLEAEYVQNLYGKKDSRFWDFKPYAFFKGSYVPDIDIMATRIPSMKSTQLLNL